MTSPRFCAHLFAFLLCSGRGAALGGVREILRSVVGHWSAPPSRLPSNSTTDAPLLGNGGIGCAIGALPRIKAPPEGGDVTWYLGANAFWVAPSQGISQCGFRDADNSYAGGMPGGGVKQLGGVTVASEALSGAPFRAEQRFSDASVRTQHGTALSTASYIHASEDTLVVHVFVGPKAVDVNLTVWTVGGDGGPSNYRASCSLPTGAGVVPASGSPVLWAARAAGYAYQNTATFNVTSAAFASRLVGLSGAPPVVLGTHVAGDRSGNASASLRVHLEAGAQVAIVTSVAIVRTGAVEGAQSLPHRDAVERAEAIGPAALPAMASSHEEWWAGFWDRAWLVFETGNATLDRLLHRYYYGALYYLATSSRSSAVAPGLYGPFITTDFALWGSDFHTNYNFQDPFHGVFTARRPELADSYSRAVLQFVPRARSAARDAHECPGLLFAGSIGPEGMYANHVGDMGQKKNALYSATVFARRWLTTRDVTSLDADFGTASTLYTMMRETVEFWMCYLRWNPEQQRYDDVNDCVGELCSDGPMQVHVNPTFTLSALRFVMGALIVAANTTGRDVARRSDWRRVLCRLAPYPAASVGGSSVTVAREGSTSVDATSPLFPGGFCPAAAAACDGDPPYEHVRAGVRRGLSAMAEARWSGSTEILYTAAALAVVDRADFWRHVRQDLLMPCEVAPAEALEGQICLYENGVLDNNNGGGLETAGGMEWVHSVLLQSRDGVLRLFPLLPPGARRARFARLLAVGAFEVSATYAQGAVREPVRVLSRQGGLLRVQTPPGWKGPVLARVPGRASQTVLQQDVEDGVYALRTEPGRSYELFGSGDDMTVHV